MLLGFAIIAIPTGIVTVNIRNQNKKITTQVCPNCLAEGHDADAIYCKYCGEKL
jgi:voltage-gated potassium channel